MSEIIQDIYDNTPKYTQPIVNLEKPNSKIVIHTGIFRLEYEENSHQVNGLIEFKWYPHVGVYFQGEVSRDMLFLLGGKDLRIYIDEDYIGKGFLTSQSFNKGISIEGVFSKECILNDDSVPVNEVKFIVPNMRELYGISIADGQLLTRGRIELSQSDHILILDKMPDYRSREKEVNLSGGYYNLYSAFLKFKNPIYFKGLKKYTQIINAFLSFVNGRQVGGLFYSGIHDDQILWQDYSNPKIEPYKRSKSWLPIGVINNLDSLQNIYNTIHELWKNEDDRDFLHSAIYWYVEVNNNPNTNSAMIIAQTILELLYNYIVIEKEGIIKGRDSEGISASNKIRLLLSRINVDYNSPKKFKEMQDYINSTTEAADAVETIVLYRNSIVHSQIIKRKRINDLSQKFKSQALATSLWYIELSLLYVLKYDNQYFSRVDSENMRLPWMK